MVMPQDDVDVEFGPVEVIGRQHLHVGQLPRGRPGEPRVFAKGEEVFPAFHPKQNTLRPGADDKTTVRPVIFREKGS